LGKPSGPISPPSSASGTPKAAALEIAAETESVDVRSVDEPNDHRTGSLLSSELSDAAETDRGLDGRSVDPVPLERDDTQLLMFTSGTSGEPKGVRLTVGNLVASATASAFRLGVLPSDRWLCCLPMYHMGGLAPVLRSALYGTPVVIQREFGGEPTARVLEEYDVTGVSLVPTMCKAPARGRLGTGRHPAIRPARRRAGLERVARALPDGGRSGASDLRDDRNGLPDRDGDADGNRHVRGHRWTAAVVHRCLRRRRDRHNGRARRRGELVVSGPTVTPGYLDEANTASAFGERGLHTGDVGYRDADGRLWILNRRSDRIVTGGENVDPGAVVAVLRSHPRVADAAVIGLADEEWGERVAALVVPDPEIDSDGRLEQSLLAHCDDRLAGFKRPKTIGFADELPRTASGTVDRDAVRDRLLEGGIDPAESP